MKELNLEEIKSQIKSIVSDEKNSLDDLTFKSIKRLVEKNLELEDKQLDSNPEIKDTVKEYIKEFCEVRANRENLQTNWAVPTTETKVTKQEPSTPPESDLIDEPPGQSPPKKVKDEPPKPKKKLKAEPKPAREPTSKAKPSAKKSKKSTSPPPSVSATTAPSEPESEELQSLKKIIVQCGVRKKWVVEFKDLPTDLQRVERCKRILKDLGMVGKPSLNKATKIREERELAKETEEIQKGLVSVTGKRQSAYRRESEAGRNGNAQRKEAKQEDDSEESEKEAQDSEENEKTAAKKRKGAVIESDSE